ncbi:AraC-like protein [Cohnella sp. SGD-V74]|uniref:helix-turn-helix transcriptional regulator n=1 Tax=unclassified Cohnella TaxID=2636738 RepID=UPI000D468154|nr:MULTISPECIES: AraC family transcriptional regulator [unclassified Cohnella]PRX62917.1 AraC-like protein [Cohnella sp. SGD-V74]
MRRHGVHIHWAARFDYKPGARLELHRHNFYQIIYFVDGAGSFLLGDRSYAIAPGLLFLIAPGVMHGLTPGGVRAIKTLDLKFRLYDNDLEQAAGACPSPCRDEEGESRSLLERIRAEGARKEKHYDSIAALMLGQLLYGLARQRTAAQQPSAGQTERPIKQPAAPTYEPLDAAQRLEQYLRSHYAEEITLGDAAAAIGYNKSYAGRAFRSGYGVTFTQYLRRVRIEKAREMIAGTSASLKTIAWQVGFKTIYHFTRVFKELERMTPAEWRERERSEIRKDIYFD